MPKKRTDSGAVYTAADFSFVPENQRDFAVDLIATPTLTAAHGTVNNGSLTLKPVNPDLMAAVGDLIHERT